MKRIILLLLLSACESSSSSPLSRPVDVDMPIPSTMPSATASAAPSASAAPTVKGNAPAPSSLSFCKEADFTADPLLAICATGQDWSKAHFECKKPLPVNFCADLSVWGCQYIAANGEKAPKVMFEARFVRPGVALNQGEIINDDGLRARFPRAGNVRGVTAHQKVSAKSDGMKLSGAFTKKLVDAGCVVTFDEAGMRRLDCGSWQAVVSYLDSDPEVVVAVDTPTTPDCTKP